jgi:hypothetical protein
MKEDKEYGRGWETFFFLSELAMLVFYIVGSRYEDGVQSYANNEEDFALENLKA